MPLGETHLTTCKLPQNIEAEQALLAALIVRDTIYDDVAYVRPEHFYYPAHAAIYAKIAEIVENGGKIAPPVLASAMRDHKDLETVGGSETYIRNLAENCMNTVNAGQWAKLVHGLALRRAMIQTARDVETLAADNEKAADADKVLAQAEEAFFALSPNGESEAVQPFAGQNTALKVLEAIRRGEKGLMTGLTGLDDRLKGLQPGQLVVVGARPSMGKTVFGMTIAANLAKDGNPAMFFSLEMPREQIEQRLLARATGIPTDRQMDGLNDNDWSKMQDAARKLGKLPLIIDDSGGLSLPDITSRARRAVRKHGVKVIVIDYLGLVRPDWRIPNKVHQIEEITNGLKQLAKNLKIPVVLLHQLSRAVEAREDKRPQLSDLRDSGAIEQDADIVMFLYRQEYYLERETPQKKKGKMKKDNDYDEEADYMAQLAAAKGKAEIITAKNRMGRCGSDRMNFNAERQVFENE